MEYNVYCDESCHLSSNDSNYMIIGAIFCPKDKVKEYSEYLVNLKKNYNLSDKIELKWNKIDKKTEKLYVDIINYFFKENNLKFRAIVIKKDTLNHKKYNQTENDFYHKSYYDMLKHIIISGNSYNIYPDIKDTNSYYNHQVTLNYLRHKIGDSDKKTIKKIQPIRSYESVLLQLNDVLVGALSYLYRDLNNNKSKLRIVNEIKKLYLYPLDKNTPFSYSKFNILLWRSRDDIS